VALDYINQKGLRPPKALLKVFEELRNRDDIVVTKPYGVVVMDKSEYLHTLFEASINDTSKFRPVDTRRPKTRGRAVKYYRPLLQWEKQFSTVISKVLPRPITDSIRSKGSRLADLYGLLKTHKEQLAMRPILSATHQKLRPQFSPCSSAENSTKTLKFEKSSQPLFTNNA